MYDDEVKLTNLKIVPEEIIIQCAKDLSNKERNTFEDLLDEAYYFRMVGLSPVFITTSNMKNLFVTSKEKLRKEYH
jgi:hypothetical protein